MPKSGEKNFTGRMKSAETLMQGYSWRLQKGQERRVAQSRSIRGENDW